jgi:hypothetical protein
MTAGATYLSGEARSPARRWGSTPKPPPQLAAAVGNRAMGRLVREARAAPQPARRRQLARLVGRLDCTAGVASAPDDPRAALEGIDARAAEIATSMADDYASDADTIASDGIPDSPSATLQAYIDHFGLPPAQGSGFLNRLTGITSADVATAAAEEVRILSRRFRLVARLLGQPIRYTCATGNTAVNVGSNCSTGTCAGSGGDAFSCGGGGRIALCDSFWNNFDDEARAAIIIHETFHMIWSQPGSLGSIDDATLRGPGRNFDVAGCYEFLVNDVFGMNSGASCPPIP